jgi:type I restriction-modification system DNA methylase subunit
MESRFLELSKKYDTEGINKLFVELLNLYKDCDTWTDPLGEFYEGMSLSKTAGFSQFFTPNHVCEMMARMTNAEVTEKSIYKILDPCSGSGRMLLASNFVRQNELDYFCAIDLDRTCVLMTALNMMFHGLCGEVVWKNALDDSDWREGFIINPYLRSDNIPSIEILEKENSFVWRNAQFRQNERMDEIKNIIEPPLPPTKKEVRETIKKQQVNLF